MPKCTPFSVWFWQFLQKHSNTWKHIIMIGNFTELKNICPITDSLWQLLFPPSEEDRGSSLHIYLFYDTFEWVLLLFLKKNLHASFNLYFWISESFFRFDVVFLLTGIDVSITTSSYFRYSIQGNLSSYKNNSKIQTEY